ncbi:MAG: nucleotidyltransferase domain-containing protein [Acidobacteria bacterium]|nr:nucleotidyltransferase domain-containing protein [Acidobacteriota bacterium]
MTAVPVSAESADLSRCVQAWHPEERLWLEQYVAAVRERYADAVSRLLVYGSKARGDAHEGSDIDLMLIVKDEAEGLMWDLRWIGYDLAATSWAVPSILARTEAEWARLERLRSPFHAAVERDGVRVL